VKIGVLGSGDVGQALAAGFATLGHEVMIGSRTPQSAKLATWLAETPGTVAAGSFADTAYYGELIVLATNWHGTANALTLADAPRNLGGKIVIDITNPLTFRRDSPPELALGHTDSGGEQVQRWLPRSRVVKAFNIVSNSFMFNPLFPDGAPTMFFCGNDQAAKAEVGKLIEAFGWHDTIDVGDMTGARLLEPLCLLWVTCGMQLQNWSIAFKLLRK
jgi:8-hydroxy-5-deazaflavin:NADPH oxidoreductase